VEILVADDQASTRMLMKAVLEDMGYEVALAENGLEAKRILEQRPISMVLSDWVMPEMDGVQLCRWIRGRNAGHYVYFIILTAQDDSSALNEGMEAGADDYLVKPVDSNELRVRIHAGVRVVKLESALDERNQALSEAHGNLKSAYAELSDGLALAGRMQSSLLPGKREIPGLDHDWLFIPAHFLAGDIFNIFSVGPHTVAFFHIDVAGHGVPSALLSFSLHNMFGQWRNEFGLLLARTADGATQLRSPADVVQTFNQRFPAERYGGLYCTMIYGVLDIASGQGQLTQAGHPNPLVFRHVSGDAEFLGQGGFPVGMLPDLEWDVVSFVLAPGDQLFLYSDGVTECGNAEKVLFGEQRMQDLFRGIGCSPIIDKLNGLETALQQWNAREQYEDDVTILGLGLEPETSNR